MSEFLIIDKQSAVKTLDYFNGFHDGFIKRIEIISQDSFEPDGSQIMTGEFNITIDFCHYNYGNDYDNKDKRVRTSFEDCLFFSLDTSSIKAMDWAVCNMSIEQSPNSKLCLIIDGRNILTFTKATFTEI